MPDPSPFEMIRKASRQTTATDRWAALKVNAAERFPVDPPAKETTAAQTEPQIPQVPFAPPQVRHPFLDEIAQRHIQAVRSALPPQEWTMAPAQPRPAPSMPPPAPGKPDPLIDTNGKP